MALYAIGDFHLNQTVDKPMDKFGEDYSAEEVIYSHLHGKRKYGRGFQGIKNGIEYKLVSSDYLGFKPELILE